MNSLNFYILAGHTFVIAHVGDLESMWEQVGRMRDD